MYRHPDTPSVVRTTFREQQRLQPRPGRGRDQCAALMPVSVLGGAAAAGRALAARQPALERPGRGGACGSAAAA